MISPSWQGAGAGPAHAAFIADILGLPHVIIPSVASTYSAFGMFAMDVGRNYARSYITRYVDLDSDRVQGAVRGDGAGGHRRFRGNGIRRRAT